MTVQEIASKLIGKLETAWNNADGKTFSESFTEEADYVDVRADYHKSRIAIEKGHQAIFDSIYKGSTVKYSLVQARILNENTFVAHGRAVLSAPSGPLAGTSNATFSFVAAQQNGKWLIESFQNTLAPGNFG
jgi:uncharacterized protein (TIGR02246 family)